MMVAKARAAPPRSGKWRRTRRSTPNKWDRGHGAARAGRSARSSSRFAPTKAAGSKGNASTSVEDGGVNVPLAMELWKRANAVCFDVDCTVCKDDSLDALAGFLGKKNEVEAWTTRAMDGSVGLERSLEERMKILSPSFDEVERYLATGGRAEQRLNPGIVDLVGALRDRGVAVYLISGGFREMALPVAKALGLPPENVYANRMHFSVCDETGLPRNFAGFDRTEPTCRQGGKPEVIRDLRLRHPYETIVMVGDGITDLEAAEVEGGADAFIGYGGTVARPEVMKGADWFVSDFFSLRAELRRYKVAFLGSGAWACAAAKLACENASGDDLFDPEVSMWVHEEVHEGRPLHETINETHENPKYAKGCFMGENLEACSSAEDAVREANLVVFCVPHEFAHGLCVQLQGRVRPDAIAISLTKGMRIRPEGPQLISEMLRRKLGVADCSVLMGANIAGEIAMGQLSEGTIGYRILENAKVFERLFQTPSFIVTLVQDVEGAEMSGTLKNVVAIAAGLSDGLGYGSNTKAAILRQGLSEMRSFAKKMFPTVRDETFLESCGVADLVASCYGGRNRRVAEAFAREGGQRAMEEVAEDLLGGQKLQGALTAGEVHSVLRQNGWEDEFPLFDTVYRIAVTREIPVDAVTGFMSSRQSGR